MPRVVAITGGTGFVGRHLVARHVALGDEVRYLTRSSSKATLNGATPFVGDIRSGKILDPLPQARMYFITARRNCIMRP